MVRVAVALVWFATIGCGRVGFDSAAHASDGATAGPDGGGGGSGSPGTDSAIGSGGDGGPSGVGDAPVAMALTPDVADTYLQGVPTTTHGSDVDLRSGRSNSGANLLPVLQFDVSALPAQPVTKAMLVLQQYAGTGSTAFAVEAHELTQAWTEAAATWSSATATTSWAGGAYTSTIYATTTVTPGTLGAYQWDITAMVNEWITGVSPNEGVELVLAAQPPTNDFVQFGSRENTTVSSRPQLVITP